MNKYGGQKLPGRCEEQEQEEFGINEPAETWGSGRSRRQRHKREVGLKNSGFILFQLNKNLKSCTGGRNMSYGLASTSPPVHQSLLIL